MHVSNAQKAEIESVIRVISEATAARKKRKLVDMFLEVPDADSWPEYYEVIPNPRSINGVKSSLSKNKYKDPLKAYEDLSLVFLNALFYNEDHSQIAKDASALKTILDKEWRARAVLPAPPERLPATSAQVKHGIPLSMDQQPTAVSTVATPQGAGPSSPTRTTAAAPKSPERQVTPEGDVDVSGTPEPEMIAMDGESDVIVHQLDRSLPRWEGFAEVGWSSDIPEARYMPVVKAILEYKDSSGGRPAIHLESLPEETNIPEVPYKEPLTLSLIEKRVQEKQYRSSSSFDKDFSKLFLKARRSHHPGSEAYGKVLLLQRFYQGLVSDEPPSGPPYSTTTNFAALPASPGTARPLHSGDAEGVPGVTMFRISTKDRKFVDKVDYKGWSVRLADWLHLSNCDDPSRPIVAQVFRCWTSDEPTRKGKPGVTVCWYFRPEQTFHPAQRQFWENEVFKTSHFAEHPLEDIIEKTACQFTARHIRGRPRPPYWYPGWPLYVCDSRYNDRERIFVKIKNWNSCVPEEVRKSAEFMPIYPFERSVFPRRHASPFVSGEQIKAPGGIGDVLERAEGEKLEGGGIGRKRPKRTVLGTAPAPSRTDLTDRIGQSRGLYVGPPLPGAAASALQNQPQAVSQYEQAASMQAQCDVDRSIIAASGGAAGLGGGAVVDRLPAETTRHFDRDPETNQVLWFAAPPVDIAHPPGPQYSLAYLSYLAKKRKYKDAPDAMDVDAVEDGVDLKKRKQFLTVTEQIDTLLTEHGVSLPMP